ncbi:SdpI family protein [Prescottella defluvii]|uniref:SdpI family protein n=1 Tax=Prescottella defluvii TaxID=1323361 RepID=UPI0004F3674F|nr:SdpI family protein [Prescottella defluvii]
MDASELWGLTMTLTSTTLLLAAVAALIPGIVGDEPNPVVGIRTKATTSSPEAWQVAHRVARPFLRRTVGAAAVGLCIQISVGVLAGFGSVESTVAAAVVCVAAFVALM